MIDVWADVEFVYAEFLWFADACEVYECDDVVLYE